MDSMYKQRSLSLHVVTKMDPDNKNLHELANGEAGCHSNIEVLIKSNWGVR